MLVKMGLMKRAKNVNEDYPFAATIPAGTTCSGTVGGQSNVCLVKLVNPSGAGPFGGVIAIQMAGAANSTAAPAAAPAAAAADSTAKAGKAGAAAKAAKAKPIGAKFRA